MAKAPGIRALVAALLLALSGASPALCETIGGVAPHHDLASDMIERFYTTRAAHTSDARRVFLFSPDHFRRAGRWIVAADADWPTANGVVRGDRDTARALASSYCAVDNALFRREHGVAVHLPFIAKFFPGAKVVPLTVRPDAPDIAVVAMRNRLVAIARPGDLFILSMDFSHYKSPREAAREDERTLAVIASLQWRNTEGCDVDARRPLALFLSLMEKLNVNEATVLERGNSTQYVEMPDGSCTSYATVVFERK